MHCIAEYGCDRLLQHSYYRLFSYTHSCNRRRWCELFGVGAGARCCVSDISSSEECAQSDWLCVCVACGWWSVRECILVYTVRRYVFMCCTVIQHGHYWHAMCV